MTTAGWVTILVVAGVLGALVLTNIGADLVFIAALTVLLSAGVFHTPQDAFAGFANEGLLTVAVLFVVAAGLRETGAMTMLTNRALGAPRTASRAQARMILPTVVMSSFMNNTPLVAMMMPVIQDWARRLNISPSKVMMPLSFASILGGICTLIGTSTNLVVYGLLVAATGEKLGLFEIAWVGVPCAIAGIAYMLIASRWLLPARKPPISFAADPREYTTEMLIEPDGPLVGRSVEEAGLRRLAGIYLMEIDRRGEILAVIGPEQRLQAHDQLVFVGVVDSVLDLQRMRGLRPATDQVFKLEAARTHRNLIEAVVSNTCPLLGQTIRDGRFRNVYNAVVIAVARNGERIHKKIGDIVLEAGDTLLLEASPSFVDQHRNSRDFFLVSRIDGAVPPRHERAWVALGILAALVIAAGTGVLSMLNAALIAACLMILTRCISGPMARRSIDWQVLIIIGAALGVGKAMEQSGAAEFITAHFLGTVGLQPWPALVVIYGLTMVFTELLTNNAAAALMFPIAMSTAHALGVPHLPFVIAVMIAASCGFATPIGYQTNLMVYGPGGYHYRDFLRFGGGLDLVVWAVAVTVIPMVWPLSPGG